jgi:hypothetical protein
MEDTKALVIPNIAYVSVDGSYGVGTITLFRPEELSEEQWETLANLSDGERLDYIVAILDAEEK